MALEGARICVGIWILKILMWQNLNFKDQQKLFLVEWRRIHTEGSKIDKNTSCSKKSCGWEEPAICIP